MSQRDHFRQVIVGGGDEQDRFGGRVGAFPGERRWVPWAARLVGDHTLHQIESPNQIGSWEWLSPSASPQSENQDDKGKHSECDEDPTGQGRQLIPAPGKDTGAYGDDGSAEHSFSCH